MMEKMPNDTLSLWREEGSQSIQENFKVFRSLVAHAKDFTDRGKYDAAAVYAQIAGFHAQNRHCGLFASPELENILIKIGQSTIQNSSYKSNSLHGKPKNILHVATNISDPFSGIPRLMRRWIQQDSERSNSLVLTRQTPHMVSEIFKEAVNNSNGKIYLLNGCIGSFVSRAKRLREIAASADVVVNHTWEHDVIPTIAFANKEQSPPVIRVNHGDHCLWFGASTSDVIANLRESGMHLSQKRRGIEPERNLLLPTVVEPFKRVLSRTEAKQKLGLHENCVLLLSVARAPKYRSIDGINFADAHVQLLKKHERVILLVIGPGDSEDWSAAIQETHGRIIVLGQTEDTAVFYQAADIYVDSFPFISNTSLLEAGGYGVPLVTRYPFSDGCEILGADMPGLTGNMIRVRNTEEYTEVISRLVENKEFRLSLGEATKRKIAEIHMGSNWLHILEDMYLRAVSLPRLTEPSLDFDQMFLGEPDTFLPRVYDLNLEVDELFLWHLNIMPPGLRFRFWRNEVKKHGFNHFGKLRYLFPEWFHYRYEKLRYGS
jgi:glycosyltransferase involved in cell wall biosynthesis